MKKDIEPQYFIIEARVVSVEMTSNNFGVSPYVGLITNPPTPKGTILVKSIDDIHRR